MLPIAIASVFAIPVFAIPVFAIPVFAIPVIAFGFAIYNGAMAINGGDHKQSPTMLPMKGESKYKALQDYLGREGRSQITLTFAEIETLMGSVLPDSARNKRAWWSNRSKGALQASAWIKAGYLVKELDLKNQQVTFHKPPDVYRVQRVNDIIQWDGELIRALRRHMGLTQAELAQELGVRQQTVSEWEKAVYTPTRASSKHLTLVAEQAQFKYEEEGRSAIEQDEESSI